MNQLIHNRVGKRKKPQKKGCLFLVVGSLLALIGTMGVILLISLLTGKVIESRHGDEVGYALMTLIKPCYGIILLLFYGILAVWYMAPSAAEEKQQARELAPMLGQKRSAAEQSMPRRTLWIITAVIAVGIVLTSLVCVNTYRLVTADGIRTYFFVETEQYKWKQVSAYTIDCDDRRGLSVTFTMRDGKQYEVLQGVNSMTHAFKETYSSPAHFATYVDKQMETYQIPANIKHYERAVKFYRDYEALWPYVSELIDYRDLNPLPDETLPETEAPTDTESETVVESDSGNAD